MSAARTPGPWATRSAGQETAIVSLALAVPETAPLAICRRVNDAAFIVRACNAHDDLVAALQRAIEWADLNKQRAGTLDVAGMRAALAKVAP